MTSRGGLIVGALLSLLACACESRVSLGQACRAPGDCASNLLCEYGRCRAQCEDAEQCAGGAICIGEPGVCTLLTDTCERTCPEGLVCAGTVCAIPCSVVGCRGGSICEEARQVCVAAAGLDGGIEGDAPSEEDASQAGDAALVDADLLDAAELDANDLDATSDTATTDAISVDAGPLGGARGQICTGFAHACAIRDGRVYCWGAATSGQLGDSTDSSPRRHDGLCPSWNCNDRPEAPVLRAASGPPIPLERVVSIACGFNNTCALLDGGSVWCWGYRGPILRAGAHGAHADFLLASGALELAMGPDHACARTESGFVCWGEATRRVSVDGGTLEVEDGRLGSDGPTTSVPRAAERFADARWLALGGTFTCSANGSEVRCRGYNLADVTGSGMLGPDPVGAPVGGLPGAPEDLTANSFTACAIVDEEAYCWGGDVSRALGRGALSIPTCFAGSLSYSCDPDAAPVGRGFDVLGARFTALSRGPSDTFCAITATSRVTCWGWNALGQAGVDDPGRWDDVSEPEAYVSTAPGTPLEGVVEVTCGGAFCCALQASGDVWCWGENDFGQLGTGTTDSRDVDAGIVGTETAALPHPYAQRVDFSVVPSP